MTVLPTCAPGAECVAHVGRVSGWYTSYILRTKISSQARAALRQLLQDKVIGTVTAIQGTDLPAMQHLKLSPEGRLAASGWSELFEQALLLHVLVTVRITNRMQLTVASCLMAG